MKILKQSIMTATFYQKIAEKILALSSAGSPFLAK